MLNPRNHPARRRLHAAPPTKLLAVMLLAGLCAGAAAQTGSFGNQALNIGSVAVNTATPATATLTFTFTASGTIAAPAVVTQGAKNLDFTDAGTGTCTTNGTSHTYNSGDTCTVIVNFTPKYAGPRSGAVLLYDSSGAPIATEYVDGSGTGPQIIFSPIPETTLYDGGHPAHSMAVDGSGNVYITVIGIYPNPGAVLEYPVGCASSTCAVALGGGFVYPQAVALDGAGNIYVADNTDGVRIMEMPPGCTSSECVTVLGGSLSAFGGVAVDGNGNIYFFYHQVGSYGVYIGEMSPSCVSSACVTRLGGEVGNPVAIALDGSGNVYVADYGAPKGGAAIIEMAPNCQANCDTYLYESTDDPSEGYPGPLSVTVDGSGNVYFGAWSNINKITFYEELPAGCASLVCKVELGQVSAMLGAMAVDSGRNLYLSALYSVKEMKRSGSPTLTFAPKADGEAGAAQTVTLENVGNEGLTFPSLSSGGNPSISANFSLDSSAANACPVVESDSSHLGTLAVNASCYLSICFSPSNLAEGNISGSLVVTDNDLNAPAPVYATQTIALNGMAEAIIGTLVQPIDETTRSTSVAQTDSVLVTGWAADVHPGASVTSVNVLIDGVVVGNATLGIPRPDVVAAYKDFSYYDSGWSLTYPAAGLAIGSHTVTAIAYDSLGLSNYLQTRTFTVASAPSWGSPFGGIDAAVDATTRSVTVAQSDNLQVSGWACDAHDGAPVSKLSILIDGSAVGNATLGIARPDVAARFNNADYLHSGWTFTYAASGLSLGTHTVTAVATDSLGNSTTFPARTITVATAPVDGPPFGSLDKAVDATTGLTSVSQADNLFVSG